MVGYNFSPDMFLLSTMHRRLCVTPK